MSDLEKIIEENMKILNRQLKEILDRIDQINGSLRETRSSLIEQITAEYQTGGQIVRL